MEKLLNLKDSVHAIDTEARELWKDDGSIFQENLEGICSNFRFNIKKNDCVRMF